MMNRNRRNLVLMSAFLPVLASMYHTSDGGEGGGGSGGGEGDKGKVKKLELTEDELQQRLDLARKEERDDAAETKRKEKEAADAEEARKKGEFETLAKQEEEKRAKAEQERDAANRRAQLAEVNVQLRDHLAHEDRRAYLANAPDIMLHVEKKLAADAKPTDVTKLIEAETAAFIERTGPVKAGSGAPAGGARGKLNANDQQQQQQQQNRSNNEVPVRRRFTTLNSRW